MISLVKVNQSITLDFITLFLQAVKKQRQEVRKQQSEDKHVKKKKRNKRLIKIIMIIKT